MALLAGTNVRDKRKFFAIYNLLGPEGVVSMHKLRIFSHKKIGFFGSNVSTHTRGYFVLQHSPPPITQSAWRVVVSIQILMVTQLPNSQHFFVTHILMG